MFIAFIPFFLLGSSFAAPTSYNSRAASTSTQTIELKRSASSFTGTHEEKRALLERSLLDTKQKYGMCTDNELELWKRGSTQQTVQLGATARDFGYFGTISLGTPAVDFSFIMDTGSADLVVMTAPCLSGCVEGTHYYDPSKSSTSTTVSPTYNIQYGSGSANGSVRSDVMSFAGMKMAQKQIFAAVTNSENVATTPGIVGVAGLAWSSLSGSNSIPFLQQLWMSGSLTSPVFGFALSSIGQYALSTTAGGVMNVGFTDSSLYSGAINYIPSLTKFYWDIPLDNIVVKGVSLNVSAPRATIDTGSSNIYVPVAVADKIYAAIGGSKSLGNGLYTYPCVNKVELAFTFGGVTYLIDDGIFNLQEIDITGIMCYGSVYSIPQSAAGNDQYIIGDTFLRNVYAAFQFEPPAVGFAPLISAKKVNPSSIIPVPVVPIAPVVAPITPLVPVAGANQALSPSAVAAYQKVQNALYEQIAKNLKTTAIIIKYLGDSYLQKSTLSLVHQ